MRVFPLSNWTELDIWEYILIGTSRSCGFTLLRIARWSGVTAP